MMRDTQTKIAAGLERAFAEFGFVESNVEILRKAAGVSLRTLYKHMPSREVMVLSALEYRHQRYIHFVFADMPVEGPAALHILLDRIANWMLLEASHGCLFHSAVAASPRDENLLGLLKRHKAEVGEKAATLSGLPDRKGEILLIIEGLIQSWPLSSKEAIKSAKRLADFLLEASPTQLSRLNTSAGGEGACWPGRELLPTDALPEQD